MLEDSERLWAHEERLNRRAERFEGCLPVHLIANKNSPFRILERVAMMPEAIGSKALFVDKGSPLLDGLDLGDPRHREEGSELDFVDDDCAGVDRSLGATGSGKAQIVWGDFIEIEGVGEKCPGLLAGDGKKLLLNDVLHG